MSTITIKFVYESETRRATYNLPITFQQIINDIAKTITATSDFRIKCYHDYREVLVRSDLDFQEIVKYHSEKTLPLRIRIALDKEEEEEEEIKEINQTETIPIDSRPMTPNSSPQVKRKEVERSHNVNCSLCLNKIHGIRWKCTVCPHYDLCNSCETNHIRSHPLIRIVEELPPSSEVVFSVCTGLHQLNQKLEKISVSPPLTSATSTAKTAKEEISEFFCDLSTQAYNNTTILTNEIGGLVQDASKIVQKIPRKFKEIQTRFSEMLVCSPASCQGNPSEAEQKVLFPEQLELLQNMGFSQKDKNIQILTKHNGNIELCINELLQD
jgi:glutamate mutase epsilon subunit